MRLFMLPDDPALQDFDPISLRLRADGSA